MGPSQLPNTFVAGFGGEDIPKGVEEEEREERRLASVRRWLLEVCVCVKCCGVVFCMWGLSGKLFLKIVYK